MTAQISTFTPHDIQTEDMSALLAQNWWAIGLRGLCAIIFGIIAFVAPGATILSLVFVFAAYMLVDGIFAIVAAVRAARQHERWGLLVLEGVANIALAAIVTLWPGLTVLAFVLWIAAWSIISGALMFGASFRLKKDHGRGWLAFGGIVSIIYGILLVIAPLVGAIVLTWWLGAYSLVFGAALIALSLQLKSRRNDANVAAPQPPPSSGRQTV
jgi:uncharacterized membrane protein HdeD (DUF308 family)